MKTYTYSGTFDVVRLRQEILVAYPSWYSENGGAIVDLIGMTYDETPPSLLILFLPNEAVDSVIDQIVQLHDPASYNPLTYADIQAQRQAFMNMPNWASWTPQQGQDYIVNNVWGGNTKAAADSYIDNTIGTVSGSNLTQALASVNTQLGNIRTVFKLAAGAVIDLRDMMAVAVKAILLLRDIVVKYRAG